MANKFGSAKPKPKTVGGNDEGISPARFKSVCFNCQGVVEPGQLISRLKISAANMKVQHADCHAPNKGRLTEEELAEKYPTLFGKKGACTNGSGSSVDEGRVREIAREQAKDVLYSDLLTDQVKGLVEAYAPNTVSLTVDLVTPMGVTTNELKGCHFQLPKLIKYAEIKKDVYLHGEPGGGKSHAVEQLAQLLGLPFGYISLELQTPPSRLVGYMTATGEYVSTLFREMYENGGVFCIDEVDNASGNLLTSLNSALGNNKGAFPDGMVRRSPKCFVFATGNTVGLGGDLRFPERRVLDMAFRDRFKFQEWHYDLLLEEALTLQANADGTGWLNLVRRIRKLVIDQKIRGIVASPRASIDGALMLAVDFDLDETLDACIFKGVPVDIRNRVMQQVGSLG